MNISNNYNTNLGIGNRISKRRNLTKVAVCFFLISLFFLNFIFIQNQNSFSDYPFINKNENIETTDPYLLDTANDISELQDPFTINFSNIWSYFSANFLSDLTEYDISTYIRAKDSGGTIVDNGVYSLDNLLLYNSLLDVEYDQEETFEKYIQLKSTPLWYENDTSKFEYGFVGTIDGTSGEITDSNRYLIDNLMPIFLLLGDGTENLDDITYTGVSAKETLENTFLLINSSQFFKAAEKGFLDFNSTSSGSIYQMKSNFYTILAYYQIYRNWEYIQSDIISIDYIYDTANSIMNSLIEKMWDDQNKGFYKGADENWDKTSTEDPYKFLDVNALGILALLDYWIENEEMNTSSLYYKNATILYNIIDDALWESSSGAYHHAELQGWEGISGDQYKKFDLESNALMMQACLKLFEVTGNITYYNRALEIYNTFENSMFDITNNAYKTSFGTIDNTNLNISSNLRLINTYLKAFEMYNSTFLDSNFNVSGKTDYIFNQGIINITSDYYFEKTISYSNPISGSNTSRYNNITGGYITYIFRYPNETIITEIQNVIQNNITTLIYPIKDKLPILDGYTLSIKANSTYFRVAFTNLIFNIISGLENVGIIGLDKIDEEEDFYQGQTENITIEIFSYYNVNLTLNVSLSGFGINNTLISLNFENNSQTLVELDIEAEFDAISGVRTINVTFSNGSIVYLEIPIIIYITDALTYSNLIYSSDVVPGNYIQISLDLINYLPNNNQSLNLTFTGEYIVGQIRYPLTLDEAETKTMTTRIFVSSDINVDSIEIYMNILKGNNTIKSQKLTVNILLKFEIISIHFPEKVIQGVPSKLILIIKNNQESSEEFSLIINDDKVDTNLEELLPGENRVEVEVLPTFNPYEFGYKKFYIELEDGAEDIILKDYFESEIQLSTINLLLFYVLPIAVPIGIILYYKNKDIKIKLLRR